MEEFDERPHRTERRYCSRINAIPAWVFVGSLLWSLALSLLSRYALRGQIGDTAILILSSAQYLFTIPVAFLLVRRVPRTILNERPLSVQRFSQWFCTGVSILWFGSIIGTVVNDLVYSALGRESFDLLSNELDGKPVWAVLLIVCIAAPVAEELLFRGLIAGRLARYGEKRAAILSGLLFGLFHGNFSQFFYAFGLGMLLAYAYFRTGRLRVPVAMHMLINLFGSLPLFLPSGDVATLGYGVAMILLSVAGVVFGARVLRRLVFAPAVVEVPLRVTVINLGMIVTLLVCVAQFALILFM